MKLDTAGNTTDAHREAMKKLEARLLAKNSEYKDENDKILKDAEASKKAAEIADDRGNRYDRSEIFLQIAVVFCSITLLTKDRKFFYVGLVLSAVGLGVGVWAFLS